MAWLNGKQLQAFKRVGRGVKISDQCVVYGAENVEIGDNVRIDAQTIILAANGSLRIGSHVHVASGCMLQCGGGITVGDFAAISFGSKLISASDDASGEYLVGPHFPEFLRKVTYGPITIADYVFLGANVTALPGVNVTQGVMVGACSLLMSNIPLKPWSIYFGVPATRIKDRSQAMVQKSIEMHKWWDQNHP